MNIDTILVNGNESVRFLNCVCTTILRKKTRKTKTKKKVRRLLWWHRYGHKKNKIHEKEEENDNAIKHRCSMIDSWALKIFIGFEILSMGTYFYCVYMYA